MQKLVNIFWSLVRVSLYIFLIQTFGFLYGVLLSMLYDSSMYFGMKFLFGYQRCNPMDEFFLGDTPKNRSNILAAIATEKFDADKIVQQFIKYGQAGQVRLRSTIKTFMG